MALSLGRSERKITDVKKFLLTDQFRFKVAFKKHMKYDSKISDFEKKALIGVGNFGRVYLVQRIKSGKYYALKQLYKRRIIDSHLVERVKNEKRLLQAINYPCLLRSYAFYIDNSYVYFLLPFLIGGDVFTLLQKRHRFDEPLSRFYAAQVVLALEYLHHMKVIYRDLKLENIVIDEIGYIKLTDYGFSKLLDGRTFTICGTPEYLAPEVVLNKGYGFCVDWWALGVIIFEFVNGSSPFENEDEIVLFTNIVNENYTMPSVFSESLKDIIKNLLSTDITKRLGNLMGGVDDIKEHKWFETVIWLQILNRQFTAPYIPEVKGPSDTSHLPLYDDDGDNQASQDEFTTEFMNF